MYLDELMDVMTHELVRRHRVQTFQFLKSNVSPLHCSGSIVLDVGVNLAFSLVATTSPLWTRSDLLDRGSRRSSLGVRSNGSRRVVSTTSFATLGRF